MGQHLAIEVMTYRYVVTPSIPGVGKDSESILKGFSARPEDWESLTPCNGQLNSIYCIDGSFFHVRS